MSRFANPKATDRLVLGPCECPGMPHDEDWMDLRSELGAQDILTISAGDSLAALEVLVVGWNLLDEDGPALVDRAHLDRLFADTFETLNGWINSHVRVNTLPNGSGGHSANGSRVTALPVQKPRKRR